MTLYNSLNKQVNNLKGKIVIILIVLFLFKFL